MYGYRLSFYRALLAGLADLLGWGPGPWTPGQWAGLKLCARRGILAFLNPPPVNDA